LHFNDLPKIISDISKPTDPSEFKKDINNIFIKINNWFKSNVLLPNFDKTHFLQLITKNCQEIGMQIVYENKQIDNTYNTKYLRLIIDSSLS
jgi:hypothetical protein